MISSRLEDALGKVSCIIALVFLLASCGAGRDSLALVSDGGVAVYISEEDRTCLVISGSVKARYIEELSGKPLEEAVSELFDIPSDRIYSVDVDEYRTRRQLLGRLAAATGAASPEYALWENGRDLEKSGFLDNIDALSSSFDSALLDAFPVGDGDYAEYRLGSIIPGSVSWEGAVDFMGRWIDSIFGD